MMSLPRSPRLLEIIRYYQAGVINTLFGFGCYALLVRLGLNVYWAQLLAHVIGMAFNYLSYSRHVFREAGPAKLRFLITYCLNYLLSLGTLAVMVRVIASPYYAGIATTILVSAINYFALKGLVFRRKTA